jgi:2-polyprenyl-3-methyl-5-hydroxy-6-metoxy-1,4-benzoquinol methylase
MIEKNTPAVWDTVWNDPHLCKADELVLAAEAGTTRWKRSFAVLQRELGDLRNKKVLEIGSGQGVFSALLAKHGAKVTLLDYSQPALKRATEFFQNNNLQAKTVYGDALKLPKSIKPSSFDISVSVGLTEHFQGADRVAINQVHLDVLRPGGLAIIITPNAYNLPYQIYKTVSQSAGRWIFGEEYPYTKQELLDVAEKIDAEVVALFGDDLYHSVRFLLPANFLRRFFGVGIPRSLDEVVQQRGTPLDDLFGYAFTLILRKNTRENSVKST